MSSLEFRVDPATKSLVKVTESSTTEDELRGELQAAADAAQNRLNVATETKMQAVDALAAAQDTLEASEVELEAAKEEVAFSASRVGELDEAVRVLASLDESPAEAADAENSTNTSSDAVNVPVTVVENSPA